MNKNAITILKILSLFLLVLFIVGCEKEVRSNHFKSYGSMVKYFNSSACKGYSPKLIVKNYDGTKYYPQIINPCEFDLQNYERRNFCYLSNFERKDGINVNDKTQIAKAKMDNFINNMGAHPLLSTDPSKAKFILELDENYPIKTVDHIIMAMSVVYEEVLHFNYRKQMKGIPIILSNEKLFEDLK